MFLACVVAFIRLVPYWNVNLLLSYNFLTFHLIRLVPYWNVNVVGKIAELGEKMN